MVRVLGKLRQRQVPIFEGMLDHLVGSVFEAGALMVGALDRNVLHDGIVVEGVVIIGVDVEVGVGVEHGGYILNVLCGQAPHLISEVCHDWRRVVVVVVVSEKKF